MPRILVSPSEFSISNEDYGKTFNLLDNLRGPDLRIDAYVSHCDGEISSDTLHVHEMAASNRLQYYSQSFRVARRELKAGSVDLYHHMNLSYRWFNPLLIAGLHGDTPVVVGPCQAGHAIMDEEFNRMVSHAVGRDLSRKLTDPLYTGINAIRDFGVDPLRKALFVKTLEAADRIVVVHEHAKKEYAKFVDTSKLRVVPLGVNPDEFEYQERGASKSLVAIGSLRERKGYDVLLDAVALLRRTDPGVTLHIFGQGPQETALRQQATELGIEDTVTFHGFVDQSTLKQHLADARAFVHPSRSESFSLVRLEAMANGCPVVVSDIDGADEMVRNGTDGFVVPREDPAAIAQRARELLSDTEKAREMGRAARERVEEKYDWKKIGQQYVNIYRSLL